MIIDQHRRLRSSVDSFDWSNADVCCASFFHHLAVLAVQSSNLKQTELVSSILSISLSLLSHLE